MALLALFPLFMIAVVVGIIAASYGVETQNNISAELRATYEEIEMPLAA
jgi:hypothetical protein